jgi:sarcosine oxidase delta subunit
MDGKMRNVPPPFVDALHQPIEFQIPETTSRARVRDDQQVPVDRMVQSLVHAVTNPQSETIDEVTRHHPCRAWLTDYHSCHVCW